uniref:Uncharacterized protein n=1 Tax=Cucumis melo TaxID=3656 RepID=A0A9I9DCX3_CUCME
MEVAAQLGSTNKRTGRSLARRGLKSKMEKALALDFSCGSGEKKINLLSVLHVEAFNSS